MMECGTTTRSMATVFISGSTVGSTTASGMRMTCRATESISMPMEYATMENINKIRKMASAITTGLTAADTQAGGLKESSMAWALTKTKRRALSDKASGKLASV